MNDQNPDHTPELTLTRAERRALPIELTPEQAALADEVFTALAEEAPSAQQQIRAVIKRCGMEVVRETLDETLKIQAGGGMPVKSGKRARTPGGVFFHLLVQRLSPEDRRETLLLYQVKKKNPNSGQAKPTKAKPGLPWELYTRYRSVLNSSVGKATTVKITLVGRPGKVKINGDTVMTMVEHSVRTASLPKGVPTPPKTPTPYVIYISLKQWRRIESALQDADDMLIVEGVCTYDPEQQGMVVFATSALSKMQEMAKREAKAGQIPSPAAQMPGAAKPVKASNPADEVPTVQTEVEMPPLPQDLSRYPIPKNAPLHIASKLYDLYSAAEQFRHKLRVMDEQPPEKRLGYALTERLLRSTEEQIASIEKPYQS